MSSHSLTRLYFESLSLPSSSAIWIGCSLAVHLGICLLPLGGSSRQQIAFPKGDAGVEVQLVASDPEPIPSSETDTPALAEIAPLPIPEFSAPDADLIFLEPETKPVSKLTAAKTPRPVAPKHLSPNEQSSGGSAAHVGSAAAQPAAQILTTQPPYPPDARELGVEGQVRLRVRVGADGSPRVVEVARSSGRADFDFSSVSTVKREWRFRPARSLSGAPIESTVTVAIHFNLKS